MAVRFHVPVLVSLSAVIPMMAAADRADTGVPSTPAQAETAALLASGRAALDGIAKAQLQLSTVMASAQRKDDRLLATCLRDKLDQVGRLRNKAEAQLQTLAKSPSEDAAHEPFVVITVVAQKVGAVVAEASRCVGAGEPDSTSVDAIEPPTDPSAAKGTDQATDRLPATSDRGPQGLLVPGTSTTTSVSPSEGDMPMDTPSTPTMASPVL